MSSDTEQMPYGLLEAMSAGLPVAATDVGDIKTIVSDLNRPFIVNVADEAALTGRAAQPDPRSGRCGRNWPPPILVKGAVRILDSDDDRGV